MSLRRFLILAFTGIYFSLQTFLIVRALFIPDKKFGFQPFAEGSYYRGELWRKLLDGREVQARRGNWTVRNSRGEPVMYGWDDFVDDLNLDRLGQRQDVKQTLAATLKYLHGALNYVAARIPEDRETVQLILKVKYEMGGRPPVPVELRSEVRNVPPPAGRRP